MTTASETRKQKGRENRERIEQVRQEKLDGTYTVPHKDTVLPGPRMPRTRKEMQLHLSGRHTNQFRDPITRSEKREWDKFWKEKGRGYTKPLKKGERF
jgi:hypothetical protein